MIANKKDRLDFWIRMELDYIKNEKHKTSKFNLFETLTHNDMLCGGLSTRLVPLTTFMRLLFLPMSIMSMSMPMAIAIDLRRRRLCMLLLRRRRLGMSMTVSATATATADM